MGGLFRLYKAVSLKMCFSFVAWNHLFVNIKALAKGISLSVNLLPETLLLTAWKAGKKKLRFFSF